MKIRFLFAWDDFWIGVFYDRKKKIVYILPLPMVGVAIHLRTNTGTESAKLDNN